MQQKYRQGKERKKAGEEERGAGKRQGEIGKDDYTESGLKGEHLVKLGLAVSAE